MNKIERKVVDLDNIIYYMKSDTDFADVEIRIEAETQVGHGCLFSISIPKFSIDGFCWNGDKSNPEMSEVLHVLNAIFSDFHCTVRVVEERK